MAKNNIDSDGILMVRYKVHSQSEIAFEAWKADMDALVKTFEGFISTTVLYPVKNSEHYYIIIRFDSKANAETWMRSDERRDMLSKSDAATMSEKQEVVHDWDIFWYSTFEGTKKWKQWAVTFMAVYPLTVIMPLIVHEISTAVPLFFFEGIIRALFISGFMTFLIMPFMMRQFKKWLHQ